MWFSPNLCRMTQRRLCCVLSPRSGWSSCEVNENVCQSRLSAAAAADKTRVCFAEDHHSCICLVFLFFYWPATCIYLLSSGALQHNWTWPTFYIYLEKKNKAKSTVAAENWVSRPASAAEPLNSYIMTKKICCLTDHILTPAASRQSRSVPPYCQYSATSFSSLGEENPQVRKSDLKFPAD